MRSKIKDVPGYERNGKAIVAVDKSELEAYRKRRLKASEEEAMRQDINNMKEQLKNIEQLLPRIKNIEQLLLRVLNGTNINS